MEETTDYCQCGCGAEVNHGAKYKPGHNLKRQWPGYGVDENGCHIWSGSKSSEGYAKWGTKYVHRMIYEDVYGEIPEGYQIDHLCRNRACINPEHLEAVLPKVNNERAFLANYGVPHFNLAKTHCPHGHEYTSENTRVYQGRRFCIACQRTRALESRARKRAALAGFVL